MSERVTASGPFRIVSALALLATLSVAAHIPDAGTSKNPEANKQPAPPPTGVKPPKQTPPAAAAAPAELPIEGAATRTAAFNDVELTGIVASIPVVVKPPKGGDATLRVSYVSQSDGVTQPVGDGLPALVGSHAVPYVDGVKGAKPPLFPVDDGLPVTLPLRLALPKTADVGLATGYFLLEYAAGAGDKPATHSRLLSVTGALPEVRLVPKEAKIRVTRQWGPLADTKGLFKDAFRVRVLGTGADAFAARGDREVELSTSRSGKLKAKLSFTEDGYAEVNVTSAKESGRYGGGVPLDPNGPIDATVPIEVEVQDAFWWPFTLLFGCALIGGYAVTWWNLKRRRLLLAGALKDAHERWVADGGKSLDWIYKLDPNLGLDSPKWPTNEKAKGRPQGGWSTVDKLHADIYAATDKADFDDRATRVQEIVATIERWRLMRRELADLRSELQRARLPTDDEVLADSQDLLDEHGRIDPKTAEATLAAAEALAQQQRIVALYSELRRAWDNLSDAQKQANAELDPAKVYASPTDEEGKDRGKIEKGLALALGDAGRARKSRPVRRAVAPKTLESLAARASDRAAVEVFRFEEESVKPQEYDRRTSGQLLVSVRWIDWLVAALTALVVTGAYLYPIYTENHTFGSWEDYLNIGLVGLLGAMGGKTLVVDWSLFPALRSYGVAAVLAGSPSGTTSDEEEKGEQDGAEVKGEKEKAGEEQEGAGGEPAKDGVQEAPGEQAEATRRPGA